jgi:hypothetical protein
MLDVHPPEHAAHSWRDFFIHIATIVIGLLIAIALEQTVEYLHHRHQLHEARESIHAELRRDHILMQQNLSMLKTYEDALQHDAALLHDATPNDATPTSALDYSWDLNYLQSTAWASAKSNNSVDYMPLPERQTYEYQYTVAAYALQYELNYLAEANRAKAISQRAATIGSLTPQDRQELLQATAAVQAQAESTRKLLFFVDNDIQDYLAHPDTHTPGS